MTWVAWRQQRLQIILSVGLVAAVAAVMVAVRLDAMDYRPGWAPPTAGR